MKKFFNPQQLLLPALVLVFFSSCQKDTDQPKPDKITKACLITKVTFAGTDAITYHYDNQNRLQHADYTGDITNAENYVKAYEYDEEGRVIKEVFKNTAGHIYGYFSFGYNSKNLLATVSFFNKPAGSSSFNHEYDQEIIYTAGNRIAKVTTTNPGNTQESRYDIYVYDNQDNVTRIIGNVVNGATTTNDVTTDYTYDNKNNPLFNNTYLGVGAETKSKNNVVTEKVTYHLSGLVKNYASTYQYNDKGYPITQTRVSETNVLEVVREYACTD